MRWLALAFLLVAPCAHAQVVEVNAGASTMFNAEGASAVFHFPQSSLSTSVGFAGGHFQFGVSDSRTWRGWNLTLGDKFFSSSVGLGIVERGAALSRKTKFGTLSIFVGSTGAGYSTPFFAAATSQHFGSGVSYEVKTHGVQLSGVAALAGPQRTAAASAEYHTRTLRLAAAGGLLQGARYWNAEVGYQWRRHLGFDVARTFYQTSTVNSAGAAAQLGPLDFHASAFSSAGKTGEALGAGARLGLFQLRADAYLSHYGSNVSGTVGEKLGRRWTVSEYISSSGGRPTLNFGGGYSGNRLSASAAYATYYVPGATGQPFTRALALTLTIRLPHDSAATIATNLSPTGRLTWAAYGGSYFYGALADAEKPASRIKGAYAIRGNILDKSGLPVVGGAVFIGGQLVYSDSSGAFFARVKRASAMPLRVALDEFSAPGAWHVVTCPATATPGAPVSVVVSR